jgi:hypothetical protein
MTSSCDQCHRTYAWLPATWNHIGVAPGTCAQSGCHVQGSNQYFMSTSTHTYNLSRTSACDNCHNFVSWTPRHIPQTKTCSGCHNDVDAKGPLSFTGHMPIPAISNCTDCHAVTTVASPSWAGGVYRHVGVIPGSCANAGCHLAGSNRFTVQSHVYTPQNYSIMMTTPACDSCHTTSNWTPRHITPTGTCNSCHDNAQAKGPASYARHTAVGTTSCTDCHSTTTITSATWAGALDAKPANHIPYNASALCSNCHPTPTTWVTGASLHAYVSGICKDCHNSSPVYLGNMTRKTLGNHEKSTTSQDCISCHARQYTRWNSP